MSQSRKYKIQVEIICDFSETEINRDVPYYVAEKYAEMAKNFQSIDAIESRVITVEEYEED